MSRTDLAFENVTPRQQLAAYMRTTGRPRLRTGDQVFWIALRRLWPD